MSKFQDRDMKDMSFQQVGFTYHIVLENNRLLHESFHSRVICYFGDQNWRSDRTI